MSQEENWKKLAEMQNQQTNKILESLGEYLKKNPLPNQEKAGSGENHSTLLEILNCPNCVPDREAVKDKLHELLGHKKCKECGTYGNEKTEYCEDCGEEY